MRRPHPVALATFLVFCGAIAASHAATARSAADFYRGKELKLAVPVGPGGTFSLYALLVAQYMPEHLPGHPTIVTEYKPGAGGVTAMNYLYNAAPRDGSVIGMPHPSLVLAQHLHPKKVKFKAGDFGYIGRITDTTRLIVTWHTTKVRTLEDAKKHALILGASGKSSNTYIQPAVTNAVLGTKFKIITGYQGSAKQFLALERGEIGATTTSWIELSANKGDWIRNGKVNILLQIGLDPVPELKNVPLLLDLVKNEANRKVADYMAHTSNIGYGLFAPPKVPAYIMTALRSAFDATVKDPSFRAEAKKRKAAINPATGAKLSQIVRRAVDTPKDVIARFKVMSGQTSAP